MMKRIMNTSMLLHVFILYYIVTTTIIIVVDANSFPFFKTSKNHHQCFFTKRRKVVSRTKINTKLLDDNNIIINSKQSLLITKYITELKGGAVDENNEESTTDTGVDAKDSVDSTIIVENKDENNNNDDATQEQNEGSDDTNSLTFSASKHGDGSESDPDGLPTRFLNMQKGDREKAKAAFIATVNWRKEQDVNTILKRPHPKYDLCSKVFPVYIPGRDVSNNIIIIQRVGLIDLDLAKSLNVTGDDLLMHYVYMVEYCWNILEPGPPDGVMTTVMDLKNVRFQTFRDAEIRSFLMKFVKMMSDHYPQRSHKTLIINAPSWVNMAYKLVKPLLRESTKKKITLLNGGESQDKALIEILGKESVPREILINPDAIETSENNENGRHSKIETEMRLFVSLSFHEECNLYYK